MYLQILWRRIGVAAIPIVLACQPAAAQEFADPPALTLAAAVELAVRDAPILDADSARIDAARADADRAGRLPDPELTFGVGNWPVLGPGAYTFGADAMTMRSIGIMQRMPSRALRAAERAQAQAGIDAAAAARTAAAGQVREAAADAWIALWSAQRKRALLVQLREHTQTAVIATRARLAGGAGSVVDVLAARGEVAAIDIRIDASAAEIDAARAQLSRWLGAAAARPLAAAPDFNALPNAPAQLLAQLDRQSALLPWSARELAADAALDAARASKRPEWRLGASYGARSAGLADMATIEVGVSLPLFARHRQDPAIRARHAERDAVQAEHEQARRAQNAAVERALAQWQGAARQVKRFRDESLPLAHDRAHAALAAYRGGGALQHWLDARRDEVDTCLAYAQALDAWGRAWAALAYLLPDADSAMEMP